MSLAIWSKTICLKIREGVAATRSRTSRPSGFDFGVRRRQRGRPGFHPSVVGAAWLRDYIRAVNVRPGKPLLFGADGRGFAFGLPGNPLSHFVCFHFAVALALGAAGWRGNAAVLGAPRWPGNWTASPARAKHSGPRAWSGTMARRVCAPWPGPVPATSPCLPAANALVRVPPNQALLPAGAEVDFLPAAAMICP